MYEVGVVCGVMLIDVEFMWCKVLFVWFIFFDGLSWMYYLCDNEFGY